MTNAEKRDMLKVFLDIADDSEDTKLDIYLRAAADVLLDWRFGNAPEKPVSVPPEYEMTQIQAVVVGYSMSGVEGQTTHNENGIYRTFRYPDMLAYIQQNVPAYVKVM